MNASIFMISRKILETTDIQETSPTAASGSPYDSLTRFDPVTAILVLISVSPIIFLVILCFKACCSGAEADSSSDLHRRRATVNSLPLIPYGGTARQRIMTDDCPICLTEFREGEFVKLIPHCGHVFHPGCLDTWLERHVTCPVCRSDELFQRGEEVCLDVVRGGSEERSTAESGDTMECGERVAALTCLIGRCCREVPVSDTGGGAEFGGGAQPALEEN